MADTRASEASHTVRLTVLEVEGIFVVTNEDDPSDWLACFTPNVEFPAQDWAERMAELYNLRLLDDTPDLVKAPLFLGTHHPTK